MKKYVVTKCPSIDSNLFCNKMNCLCFNCYHCPVKKSLDSIDSLESSSDVLDKDSLILKTYTESMKIRGFLGVQEARN